MTVETVTVAALAVADPVSPPVPPSVARDAQFDETRRAVALPEARLLALESKGTGPSPDPSDRRNSVTSAESVDIFTS